MRFQIPLPVPLYQRRYAVLPVSEVLREFGDLIVFLFERLFCFRAQSRIGIDVGFELVALPHRDFQVVADVLELPLQVIAARKRFFERIGQFTGPHLRILVRCLVLADLLHQALVLPGKPVVFRLLRIDLRLPAGVNCQLFTPAAAVPEYPAKNKSHQQGASN